MDAIQLIKKQKNHDSTVEEVTKARTTVMGKTYPNLKARLDDIEDAVGNLGNQTTQNLYWKDAVTNKAGLGVYTPNAKDGWCATVLDENAIYRYEEGTQTWIKISSVHELATPDRDGLMSSVDKDKLDNLDQNYVGKNGDSTINGTLTVTGGVNGNATSSSKLETPREISLEGDVTGTVTFDGTRDVIINATHMNVQRNNTDVIENVAPGNSFKAISGVTSDTKGHIVGVETKTITISSNDENVKNELDVNTKAYITGTTSNITNTGTQIFDDSIYIGDKQGELHANTFVGNLNGTAEKSLESERSLESEKITTPRDVTIGNTTRQFDGTSNISWTIDEIADFNLEMDVREYTVNQPKVNEIPIGVNVEIDDIVMVYMSGVRLHPNKHYNLIIGADAKITPGQGVEFLQDDHFTFEILRLKVN